MTGKPHDAAQNDTELTRLISHGDADALGLLFDRHAAAVLRYAWGLADRRSDVDDLVQETFLTLWKRRKSVSIVGDSALPWLLVTCRQLAWNANRKTRRNRTAALTEAPEAAHATAAWSRQVERETASEELRWVLTQIEAMSDIDQQLCALCLLDGRSYAEAAAILGITPANARKKVQRTRARLQVARAEIE